MNTNEHERTERRQSVSLLSTTATVMLSVWGVLLPLATLGIELVTGTCAESIFDPIPSLGHIILVALVPLANLAVIVALRRRESAFIAPLGWLNGMALGVAGLYALLFLPFTVIALVATIFFGLGFLPLSPLIAFICCTVLRVRLRRFAAQVELPPPPGLWVGLSAVALLVFALELPKALTLTGMRMAVSGNPAEETRGLRLLRNFGNDDTILRACYVRSSGMLGDPISTVFNLVDRPISEDQARTLYYRVTGTPFNAVKPPKIRRGRGDFLMNEFDFDAGGDRVQGRLRGLSLADSRADVVVDAKACTAYTEWTMTFKNASYQQLEARAQVMLPPGSVVSRLTLWIDGQEHEAAFGGRSQVREAYNKVVSRRRDPVLVTTSGPDQILVQCFPVPPQNGIMKIRMGITTPLDLDSLSHGLLRLPFFVEHNFGLPEGLGHSVWLESHSPLASAARGFVQERRGSIFALRGTLKGADLEGPVAVEVTRDAGTVEVRTLDTRGETPAVVTQTVRRQNHAAPGRIVMVIDGSRRMKEHADAVAEIVQSLPDGIEFAVLQASDVVVDLVPPLVSDESSRRTAIDTIREARFSGGCNNAPAIAKAWDLAAASKNGVILWLHATQPVNLGDMEALHQRWARNPDGPRLLGAQFDTGPDVVTQGLDGLAAVQRLARSGAPKEDVKRQLAVWAGKAESFTYDRMRLAGTSLPDQDQNLHVVRLWANGEVLRLAAAKGEAGRQQALSMARMYQLVTPVSGAVVLETQQQYQEAGLEPVPASSVPSVPEPELWMLLVVAVFIVAFMTRREKLRTT